MKYGSNDGHLALFMRTKDWALSASNKRCSLENHHTSENKNTGRYQERENLQDVHTWRGLPGAALNAHTCDTEGANVRGLLGIWCLPGLQRECHISPSQCETLLNNKGEGATLGWPFNVRKSYQWWNMGWGWGSDPMVFTLQYYVSNVFLVWLLGL